MGSMAEVNIINDICDSCKRPVLVTVFSDIDGLKSNNVDEYRWKCGCGYTNPRPILIAEADLYRNGQKL
jgi:hypothetical protein